MQPHATRAAGALTLALALLAHVAVAGADVVILNNGDKLTGKVGQISGGKMNFNSPMLGDITIDLANVESFTTDEPAVIRRADAPPVEEKITEGTAEQITTESGAVVPLAEVKIINPPPQKWTGALLVAGTLVRGNTETADLAVSLDSTLRREDERHDDRTSLGARYNVGSTGTGDDRETTTDNWSLSGKYDRFFSDKLYGYANVGVMRDRIADLDIRITPGIGAGYQWVERPDFNFNTEAGVSYVYEEFDDGSDDDYLALRLAYHLDKRLDERLSLFHNLEYLPAFDDFGNFILRTDVGLRADLAKNFFGQLAFEWIHDSEPAPGAEENDYRYLLGVGWQF